MKEIMKFEKIPMEDVPAPINARTRQSAIWPMFEAIVALPSAETHAIKVSVNNRGQANTMMNKFRAWGREFHPGKKLVNNRTADGKTMYVWWVSI